MHDPLGWIKAELDALREQDLLRQRRRSLPLAGGWCELDGRRLRNFAGNDYLDLAHDPRVVAAAAAALAEGGASATASALVVGRTVWHDALELRLAKFLGKEAAILFPTGYAANLGTIAALVGPGDVVLCDRLNHSSLVDGCRLSGARVRLYRHDDLVRLERGLEKASAARRKLIVSDGLFSMDGDCPAIPILCDCAERHGAALMIDEAHTIGVFGHRGRGVAAAQGVAERVPVLMGTLSKGLGSLGGFVAGSQELVDWLWNSSRTQMFSTALPPSACAAALAALDIVEAEPERRDALREREAELRAGLKSLYESRPDTPAQRLTLELLEAGRGQIVVAVMESAAETIRVADELAARGYLVAAIRPPTVPRGTSRLRISLMSCHTEQDIAGLLEALSTVLSA